MSIVSFIFATIKKSDYMSPDSEYTETHENKIYATLDKLGIAYQSLHHPAIMTMEEGAEIAQKLGCTSCKSLFLTNKQQEYFMLLLPANKKLKTKELAGQIGSSHLSFASEKAMENLLCTFPGAVSILGLIYDKENKVQLLIDKEILESTYIGCHPCVNTFSLKIRLEHILKILLPKISHQNFNIVEL